MVNFFYCTLVIISYHFSPSDYELASENITAWKCDCYMWNFYCYCQLNFLMPCTDNNFLSPFVHLKSPISNYGLNILQLKYDYLL